MARSPQLINLKRELYQRAIGMPEDPSGLHEMTDPINYLMGTVSDLEMGEVGIREARNAFKMYAIEGFDFDWWLSERIAEGYYEPGILEQLGDDEVQEEFDPTIPEIPSDAVNVVPFKKPIPEEV